MGERKATGLPSRDTKHIAQLLAGVAQCIALALGLGSRFGGFVSSARSGPAHVRRRDVACASVGRGRASVPGRHDRRRVIGDQVRRVLDRLPSALAAVVAGSSSLVPHFSAVARARGCLLAIWWMVEPDVRHVDVAGEGTAIPAATPSRRGGEGRRGDSCKVLFDRNLRTGDWGEGERAVLGI